MSLRDKLLEAAQRAARRPEQPHGPRPVVLTGPWPWCEMYRTWKSQQPTQATPETDTTVEHIAIVETWRADDDESRRGAEN